MADPKDLDAEIETLRAQLAEQEEETARERRETEAKELRLVVNEGHVARSLKKTHGQRGVDFDVTRSHDAIVAFSRPKGPHWEAFVATVKPEESMDPHEVRNVVRRSLVEHEVDVDGVKIRTMTRDEFDKAASTNPAMAVVIADQLHDLAKGGIKKRKGK